jgi:hypothetical protein
MTFSTVLIRPRWHTEGDHPTFSAPALQNGVYKMRSSRADQPDQPWLVGVRKLLKGAGIRSLFKTLWFDSRHSSQRPFLPPTQAGRGPSPAMVARVPVKGSHKSTPANRLYSHGDRGGAAISQPHMYSPYRVVLIPKDLIPLEAAGNLLPYPRWGYGK